MIQLLSSMAYTFLIVSYLASTCSEALSSLLGWRGKMLLDGVRALLNDDKTQLAQGVYESPLIDPRRTGIAQASEVTLGIGSGLPSYIDPKTFAIVLLRLLKLNDPSVFAGQSPEGVRRIVTGLPGIVNDRVLQELLINAVERAGGNPELVSDLIAVWFENMTSRVTGAYKRRIQLSNFCVGLAMAVLFHISPFPSVSMPSPQGSDALADTVGVSRPSAAATALDTHTAAFLSAISPAAPRDSVPRQSLPAAAEGSRGDAAGSIRKSAPFSALVAVAGWLLTALSTLFGAPFWYNVLSKINPANPPTKGVGPLPKPPPSPETAPPSSGPGPASPSTFR